MAKKGLLILALAALIAGGAFAIDGLYAGAEVRVDDFMADEIIDNLIIRPYVGFETSLDMGLDAYAELSIPILFTKAGDTEIDFGLGIDLGATYYLELSRTSELALSLDVFIENWFVDGSKIGVGMEFGALFTQFMDFGDLYIGIDVPFNITNYWVKDPFDFVGLNITVGVDNIANAIGAGLTLYNDIQPDVDFAQYVDIFGSYTAGPLFAQLTIGIPLYKDGFKIEGLTIIPYAEYSLDMGLKIYGEIPIMGIAADLRDLGIGLLLGAKFSF
ncbi:MAG: hypothetical protein FWD47_10845 [Treponema sp.]|nr:hypothetical protein [Treponema sp.]